MATNHEVPGSNPGGQAYLNQIRWPFTEVGGLLYFATILEKVPLLQNVDEVKEFICAQSTA